jgi:hypothetical protein
VSFQPIRQIAIKKPTIGFIILQPMIMGRQIEVKRTIRVVTDKLLPTKGEKLKVTGHMTAIEIGTERRIVLREKSDSQGQKGR